MADQVLSKNELKRLYENVYALATNDPPVRLLLYRPLFALVASNDPQWVRFALRVTMPLQLCLMGSLPLSEASNSHWKHSGRWALQDLVYALKYFGKSEIRTI